jgi:hypothetical protein
MSTTAKHWPWETDTAGNEGAQWWASIAHQIDGHLPILIHPRGSAANRTIRVRAEPYGYIAGQTDMNELISPSVTVLLAMHNQTAHPLTWAHSPYGRSFPQNMANHLRNSYTIEKYSHRQIFNARHVRSHVACTHEIGWLYSTKVVIIRL